MAAVFAFLGMLLISMLVTAALAAGGKYLAPYLPEASLQVASFIVSFGVISLLFAMTFKWLPDATITVGTIPGDVGFSLSSPTFRFVASNTLNNPGDPIPIASRHHCYPPDGGGPRRHGLPGRPTASP